MIGGTYLSDTAPHAVPVPKALQRKAVLTLLNLYRELDWMEDRTAPDNLDQRRSETEALRIYMLSLLDGRLDFIQLNQGRFKQTYTVNDYADDVFGNIFSTTLKGGKLNNKDRALQEYFVQNILSLSSVYLPVAQFAPEKKQNSLNAVTDNATYTADIAHYDPAMVAEQIAASGDKAYEMPGKMIPVSGGASKYYYDLLWRTRKLFLNAVKLPDAESRGHYQYLLFKINQALDVK